MRFMKSAVVLALALPMVASAQAGRVRKPNAARKADTVHVVDTLRITDTVRVADTVRFADTVRVADTVRLADTVRVADTVQVAVATRCSCMGRGQQGRTIMTFGLGLTGERQVLDGQGQTTARMTGQLASFSFTHYVSPAVGFDFAAAVLDADASHAFNSNTATGVTTLLFGMSYSPPQLALSRNMRPFVAAAIGPYLYVESQRIFGNASTSVVSHTGARFSGGMNIYFAHIFALQIEGDYHNVEPFDALGGGTRDPSGFSMSLGFGFAFGGR